MAEYVLRILFNEFTHFCSLFLFSRLFLHTQVVLQRLTTEAWEAVRKDVRQQGEQLTQKPQKLVLSPAPPASPARLLPNGDGIRPLRLCDLHSPAMSKAAAAVVVAPVATRRLRQSKAAFCTRHGLLCVADPSSLVAALQPGDVVAEAGGRNLLAMHDSQRAWHDMLKAATRDMVLLTVLRGALPAENAPANAVVAATASAASAASAPVRSNPQQTAHSKVSDGALLKRLDDAHLRLQALHAVEYPYGQKIPDIRSLPEMPSPEARAAAQRLQALNAGAPPLTQCSYALHLPLSLPMHDLGFALATLPDNSEGGRVVIHSVWSRAAIEVGEALSNVCEGVFNGGKQIMATTLFFFS